MKAKGSTRYGLVTRVAVAITAGALVVACGGEDRSAQEGSRIQALADDIMVQAALPVVQPIYPNDRWVVTEYRPLEWLRGEYHIDKWDTPVIVTVLNGPFDQTIQLSQAEQILYEQTMSWDGELKALRVNGTEVPDNVYARQQEQQTISYLSTCAEEGGWNCYLEQLDVLSHLQYKDPVIFPAMSMENVTVGLEALADAVGR